MPDLDKTYRIGDVAITRIVETVLGEFPVGQLFPGAGDAPPGQPGADAASDSAVPVTLAVNIWVVRFAGNVVLVDTGVGNHKDRPFNAAFHNLDTAFLERLAELGVQPADVTHVLHTHLHTDHVGWNTRLEAGAWVPTFPSASHVIPAAERAFYETPAAAARRMVFEDSIAPVLAQGRVELIGPAGGDWRDGIAFLPTPGHSPGHMSIRLRSGGQEAIFMGDVLHAPLQVGRLELNSIFCAEGETARASRRQLLEQAARCGALLLSSHFPGTGAGRITGGDGRLAWTYI